jgi:hypothetical protein
VRITRKLFDYALTKGVLKYKDLNTIRDIKIDTRQWLVEQPAPSITHTLPL